MTSFHWLRQSKKVEYHDKRETGKFCSWAVRYMSEQCRNTPQEGCCNLWCIVKMSCKSPPAIAATSTNQKRKCTPTRPSRDFVRQKEYHLRIPCKSSLGFPPWEQFVAGTGPSEGRGKLQTWLFSSNAKNYTPKQGFPSDTIFEMI
jgi:hypothetical protein